MLVLITGFFYDFAHACSCMMTPPPRQALKESKAVFTGKVISMETFDVKNNFVGTEPVVRVKFLVSRTWKGVQDAEAEVYTSGFNPACGFNFVKGKEYLVYAYPDRWKLDVLETGICNRTAEIKKAKKDLRAIGKGIEPNPRKSAFNEKAATRISSRRKKDEESRDFSLPQNFDRIYLSGVKNYSGEICSGNYIYGFDSLTVSQAY